MNVSAGHALEQALAYYRAPALLPMARRRPLPDDVLQLLRLAAGDEELAGHSAQASGETPQAVIEAAVFFVQQILFAPGSDSHRVLGVNPGAPDARIKEHYRWLVRWLHPDRNTDEWDSVYADRVTRAWSELRRRSAEVVPAEPMPMRRATDHEDWTAFSQPRTTSRDAETDEGPRHRISREHPAAPLVSSRTARRLPLIVLGSLGAFAGALLALMWYAQSTPQPALQLPPVPQTASQRPEVGAASAATELQPFLERPAAVAAEAAPTENVPFEAPAAEEAQDVAPADVTQVAAEAALTDARPARPAPAPVGAASAATTPTPRPAAVVAEVAATPPPSTPAPTSPITESEAQAVLSRFTNAYATGNLNDLMRVFTRDATNNRGGRNEIAYDYQALFARSSQRDLRLDTRGWMQHADGATILAKYQAGVTPLGKRRSSTSRGDIRFDFRIEDGVLKISRIRHDT